MSKQKNTGVMEQLNKLSKRELVLIYILIVFAVLAGGITFLIKPAIETHDDVLAQLSAAEQERDEVNMVIDQKVALQDQIVQYNKNISKLKKKFNEVLENEDIDSAITGMITASGLRPMSLQIAGENQPQAGTSDGAAQGQTDAAQQTETNGTQNTNSNTPTPAEITAGAGGTVKTTSVSIKAEGSLSQISGLIGRIDDKKGVCLRSYNVSRQEDGKDAGSVLAAVLNSASKKKTYAYVTEMVLEVYQSTQV